MVITFGVSLQGRTLVVEEVDSRAIDESDEFESEPEFSPTDIANDMGLVGIAPESNDRSPVEEPIPGPIPHGSPYGPLIFQTTPTEVSIAGGFVECRHFVHDCPTPIVELVPRQ